MQSRTSKFSSNNGLSRSNRNKELYKDLYKDTNYSNMVVLDDVNEVNISKIKEIIDEEKKPTREFNNKNFYDTMNDIYKMEDEKPKKTYDINKVLKEAKNKRDIIEEANEKRKIENYKFKSNLDLESELAKTRRVYNDLVKEETELLNIMNTLTNINSDKNLSNTTSMALDLLEDFKDDPVQKVEKAKDKTMTNNVNVKQIQNGTQEYNTDTFMFNTNDFESIKNITNQIKKSSVGAKIFVFIFSVAVFVGSFFLIKLILK